MKELQPTPVTLAAPRYPVSLRQRLGTDAPPQIKALGNIELLTQPLLPAP